MIMVHHPPPARPWVVDSEATLDIATSETGNRCQWAARKVVDIGFRHPDVQCAVAVYSVRLNGTFVSDADTSGTDELRTKSRHRLSATAARAPGMRFTVRCPEVSQVEVGGLDADLQRIVAACKDNPNKYWQDNTQFAAHLGVDVGSMQYRFQSANMGSQMLYQDLGQALGLPPFTESSQPKEPWLIRWAAYAPDGRIVRKDSIVTRVPPSHWGIAVPIRDLSPGVRRRVMVPEFGFMDSPSDYGVLILDVEVARP